MKNKRKVEEISKGTSRKAKRICDDSRLASSSKSKKQEESQQDNESDENTTESTESIKHLLTVMRVPVIGNDADIISNTEVDLTSMKSTLYRNKVVAYTYFVFLIIASFYRSYL